MEIIRAAAAHAAGIHAVECACFSRPWSEEAVLAELENGHSALFAAVQDGQVIGWAGLEYVCGEGSVTNIAVLPAFRGQGLGRALTLRLIEEAQRRTLDFLMLEVRASNTPAIALYRSLGFTEIGVRRGFYEKPREDALLFRIEFTQIH